LRHGALPLETSALASPENTESLPIPSKTMLCEKPVQIILIIHIGTDKCHTPTAAATLEDDGQKLAILAVSGGFQV
jgi:hypothetical protein